MSWESDLRRKVSKPVRPGQLVYHKLTSCSPADLPGVILELKDLPTGSITKIAAGGYIAAALTSGNDLYLWGGRPGIQPVVEGIGVEPMPIVIEDKDILDMAVGEAHIVTLTTDGEVYVIGENRNGQLGLGTESAKAWAKVNLDLADNQRIAGVAAGPRCSFIIVQKT